MTHATPPDRTALDVARGLTDAVNGLSGRLEEVQQASEERDEALAQYGKRNRLLIWIAITSLSLDVAATVVAIVSLIGVHHNAATVQDIHNANLAGCQANNVRLARQEAVLNGILRTPAHASPAARVYLAHARAEIAVGWKARDCTVAYRLRP